MTTDETDVWFGGNADFGGRPLWGGTALVDILPFEHVLRKRGGDNVRCHFPATAKNKNCVLRLHDLLVTVSGEIDAALTTLVVY